MMKRRSESEWSPADILPIQIRPNLVVHIAGIPFNLTEAEAAKIAAVIIAMAQPKERSDDAA